MSPHNSQLVACVGEVVVAAKHNATAGDVVDVVGIVAVNDVVVVVGAAAMVVVWVQRCWMRPCTSLQSHFVLVMVTLRGNELSWWYRQTTQGPHSTMGRLVFFNHGVDRRDNIRMCGHPLRINGVYHRDNIGECH